MFKCKTCGKEFPVVAWIETATTTYPTIPNWQGINSPQLTVQWTNVNWSATTTIIRPCCPYCQRLDLEELKEKDEFLEQFKEEFLKAIKDKAINNIADADKKS